MQGKFLAGKFSGLLVLPMIFSSIFSSPAQAGTYSYKVLQIFGWENGGYKVMVQRNGYRYFVWYQHQLSLSNGQTVLIDFDYSDRYWEKINNPRNGSWASISSVSQIK